MAPPRPPDDAPCYLDGAFLPLGEARVHPFDRGFVYGDGVYEVMKVLDGVPLFVSEHLERMARGLDAVRVPRPPGLEGVCRQLIEASGVEAGSVYLQVTRGVAVRTHIPPPEPEPTVFAYASAHPLPGEERLTGCAVVTMPDIRWHRCDIKTTSLMATVVGKLQVADAGAREVIFRCDDGRLREGGSTNLFVKRDGVLETHPLDGRILPGVTRDLLLHITADVGFPVRERAPRLDERETWEEVLLCGTLTSVQGVTSMDGEPVAGGRVGEWTRMLVEAYDELERWAASRSDGGSRQ